MNSIFYEDAAHLHEESTNESHEPSKNKTMNINVTVTEQKNIKKEISLPYYAQDVCFFLMIAKNKTVIRIKPGGDFLGDEIERLAPDSVCYNNALVQAATGKEISQDEFITNYNKVNDKIMQAIEFSIPQTA